MDDGSGVRVMRRESLEDGQFGESGSHAEERMRDWGRLVVESSPAAVDRRTTEEMLEHRLSDNSRRPWTLAGNDSAT